MAFDINENNRRSIRLAGYDYRAAGGYFVTICAAQKRCAFGKIANGVTRLHPYGEMVETCWRALPEHFGHVALDEYAVMPNHFHGILIFNHSRRGSPQACPDGHIVDDEKIGAHKRGTPEASPYNEVQKLSLGGSQAGSLSVVIGQFKMHVTRAINKQRAEQGLSKVTVWQRNYYERIIRDENELNETRRYIIENPLNWPSDEHYRL